MFNINGRKNQLSRTLKSAPDGGVEMRFSSSGENAIRLVFFSSFIL